MKKQILILTFFVAAIFAGTNAFGQTYTTVPVPVVDIDSIIAVPLDPACDTANALHPNQDVVYTYTVETTSTNDSVRWFVVNYKDLEAGTDSLIGQTNLIIPEGDAYVEPSNGTGDYIYYLGDNHNTYDQLNNNDHQIEIAWKYFDGVTDVVLLVAYVQDSAGCTDNISVMRIIPQPAFTIDVVALNDAGDSIAPAQSSIAEECVSPIESAVYSGYGSTTPGGTLTVDYGENWIFFEVNGANYLDSWMPQFQLTYAGGTVPPNYSVSWAYLDSATSTNPTYWHEMTGGDLAGGIWNSPVPVVAGAGTAGSGGIPQPGGENIVVRVQLDWGTLIEHDDADGTLTFAVDGIAYDGSIVDTGNGTSYYDDPTFGDLNNTDSTLSGFQGTSCETDGFLNDWVNYIITPRPEVEAGDPQHETKTGDEVN
ncbi:hypothetical protein [Draconibacterium sediminis]|uniref:Cleaved adhesin domain-containing protein n=1 Tax=Draconibacterium sediminis TaxID=1544798 RepID=A0A0D8J733_9BACT|nr:hypothetical protein [Draconibacterium sediminis]KJF41618.1 hypothetical protein LH29_24520 [Draconibacterium sediminis]